MPLVTVAIPAYNHAAFLREALESVLAQTFRDFEIIVVDDGSSDDTWAVCQEYADRGLIRCHRQENQGQAGSRNRLIEMAAGEYIAFLDDDDLWLPEKLERQLPLFNSQPCPGLVYSLNYRRVEGRDVDMIPHEPHRGNIFETLLMKRFFNPCTVMVPRQIFDEVGRFDPELRGGADDWDMWLRIAFRYEIDYVPEPLAVYREHPAGAHHDYGAMVRCMSKVLEKTFSQLEVAERYAHLKAPAFAQAAVHEAYYAYRQRNFGAFRRALLRAVKLDPALALEPRHWFTLAKSLAGPRFIDGVRTFRQHFSK